MDGKLDNSLPNCAIMDNYYVDKPVWMVDLGKSTNVNGVIVHTWQGAGQGKIKFHLFFWLRFLSIKRPITFKSYLIIQIMILVTT